MDQSHADQVWNRAALDEGGANAREGDRALAALLRAHGAIMNGGVHNGLEFLSPEELQTAEAGYTFFGFNQIPPLLERAPELDEAEADTEYAEIIPDDSTISRRFEDLLDRSPELFSPLD